MSEVDRLVGWFAFYCVIGAGVERYTRFTLEQFAIVLILISAAAMLYGFVQVKRL